MTAIRLFTAIAAVVVSPIILFLGNTAQIRSARLKVFLGTPIAEFNPTGAPFIPKVKFMSDMEKSVMSSGGIKVK